MGRRRSPGCGAQNFSRFYTERDILLETNAALRGTRLDMCELTLAEAERLLLIFGITVPERM